jgi:hypothetical protein
MSAALSALVRALPYLALPRVLLLVLLPFAAAAGAGAFVAWRYREAWSAAIARAARLDAIADDLARFDLQAFAPDVVTALLIVLVGPIVLFAAVWAVAAFGMGVVVDSVARREYPFLERRVGGSRSGSFANALFTFALYVLLWIVSLPLWLVPPFAILLPWALTAWLVQRVYRYDALASHAAGEEREAVVERAKGKLYLLALGVTVGFLVPGINLIAPVYAAVAFAVLGLSELDALRRGRGGTPAGGA